MGALKNLGGVGVERLAQLTFFLFLFSTLTIALNLKVSINH